MKKINKFLFLMFGLGVAACFVACGSDSNDSYEEDVVKEVSNSNGRRIFCCRYSMDKQ